VGAVVLVAALLASFGRRLRTDFPSLDMLIIVGTLTVTQLSAFFLPVDVIARYGDTADPQSLLDPSALQRLWVALPAILLVAAAIGLAWDWRRWAIAAGIFAAIYVPLYTSLFSHGLGLTTGAVGSLAYWLGQQGVERGSQPWYYFLLIQVPIYEFLPAIGAIAAGVLGVRALVVGRREESRTESTSAAPRGISAPFFLGYWSLISLLAYSAAGEKMPWLTVHVTLPMILLSGWVLGKFLDGVKWRAFREGRAWAVAGLLALALLALAAALGYLLGANPPFRGVGYEEIQSTIGFLVAVLMAVGAVVAVTYVAMGWRPIDLTRFAGVLALGLLFLLTARAAFRASFINYDNATEFLVYAHSATGSKTLLSQVEDLSMRTTDGLAIDVAYDNETSYPYMWYLRDYTHVHPFGETPGRDLLNYPIIIVGAGNWPRVEPIVGDRYYSFEYTRMWWPMQDYWGLTWERISNALRSPDYRAALWDIWLNRDYTAYGNLTGSDFSLEAWQPNDRMRLYVRKDIAAMIWDFGALPAAYQPEPFVDPYEDGLAALSADLILGAQPGEELSFIRPRGMDLAPDGSLYVADTGNSRIFHLSAEGEILAQWGSFANIDLGPAPEGTFNEPWDVAVAPDGSLYVADTWNHRIQHFTGDGEFIEMFGTFGQSDNPTELWGPRAVEVDDQGRLYVADTGNKRILVFNAQGESVAAFGGPGYEPGSLNEPVGLAIADDGTLFVADTWNMRIQGFVESAAGQFDPAVEWPIEGWYGQGLENKPYLDVSSDGQVCSSDPEGNRILCFTTEGEFILGWGSFGTLDGQFNFPSGVAFDAESGIWVVDSGNNRLLHFSPDFGD
jgi:DNA-binding beta-propeller fold protein YncE